MKLEIGQRWRWIFDVGFVESDLILEVVNVESSVVLRTIQIIKGLTEDHIGREFEHDVSWQPNNRFHYLEGQDKPL